MFSGRLPATIDAARPKPTSTMHWPMYSCCAGSSAVVRPSGQRVHAFKLPLAAKKPTAQRLAPAGLGFEPRQRQNSE